MVEKKFNKGTKICATIIIIAIVVFFIALIATSSQNNNYTKSASTGISTKENPYEIFNKYDGTYSFKMESNTRSGYNLFTVGIITLDNGKCNIKYIVQSDNSIYEDNYEFNGFCGINNNEDSNFYLNLNNNKYIYKCEQTDNGLICELKSKFDLAGYTNNSSLNLELLNELEDKDAFYSKFVNDEKTKWKSEIEQRKAEEKLRKEEEEKAQKEAEERNFKESCQTYTFEQIARNPENFKGTNVKLTGEVVQALYGTNSVDLRVDITKKGYYSTYYTDTIYVTYNIIPGEDKILEDDIITIYGTSMGDYSYTSTMGAKITLPWISAKYITLNQ